MRRNIERQKYYIERDGEFEYKIKTTRDNTTTKNERK
jgi:hypothetical protein